MIGLQRTKNDIVVEQVKKVLEADTIQKMFLFSLESMQRLEYLGVFKYINIKIDTAKDERGEVEGMEVTFRVKELGKVTSSLAANAGTQSGDAVSRCDPLPGINIDPSWSAPMVICSVNLSRFCGTVYYFCGPLAPHVGS